MAEFNHSLNDPTAELIYAIIHQVDFNLLNECNSLLTLDLMTHLYDDLLNNMVSIEIERAVFNFV